MSGVAKDETNPATPTDETLPAVPAADASSGEPSTDTNSADAETRAAAARRTAPHLRVVTDNDASELAVETPHRRIGAVIRAARENQGLTLDTVAKETRIHLSHLRAIEDMTPNLLGAPVYAKGYIRNYARHLKLDPDETLQRYLSECAILTDPEKQEIAPPVVARKLPVAAPVLGLLVVALVVGGGAVMVFNSGGDARPSAEAGAVGAAATVAAGESAAAMAAAGPPLRLVAINRARIEVRGADGTKFLARFFSPGESYTPRVGAGWTVTTEDGAAFEWRLGEQSLGPLSAGGPVFAQGVDEAAKRPPVVVAPPPPPRPSATEANSREPAAAEARPVVRQRPAPVAAAPAPEPVVVAPPPAPNDPAMLAYPEN